ncbi:MAG: tetratricopeptide repeat protein [Sporolactobacillus sp.]
MKSIETAHALMAAGQTEKGLDMLSELVSDPDDSVSFQAASVYQSYGFLDEAEQAYKKLLNRYPDDSELLLALSELLIDKDQEDQAIDYLLHIPEDDENYLSAQVMLADLYQMEGLDEVAENKLLGALASNPDDPILLQALGEVYLSEGKAIKAAECFETVRGNPELADQNIELKLAEAYSLSGEFERAVGAFRRGLKKEKTLDGLFGYAITAARIGKYKTTIHALEELRQMDPSYSTLYPLLADAYSHEGEPEKALKTIEAGLEEDDYNERLYKEAAELSLKTHQKEKAAYYFQKWLDQDPDSLEALTRLIELLAQDQDYEGIIDHLEKKDIADPMLQWFLATAYNETDQLPQAGRYYELCAPAFADNPEFLQEYGTFKRDLGETAEGLRMLEAALKLNPENDDLAEFIKRIKQDDFD